MAKFYHILVKMNEHYEDQICQYLNVFQADEETKLV
jgi:hypothetical protein